MPLDTLLRKVKNKITTGLILSILLPHLQYHNYNQTYNYNIDVNNVIEIASNLGKKLKILQNNGKIDNLQISFVLNNQKVNIIYSENAYDYLASGILGFYEPEENTIYIFGEDSRINYKEKEKINNLSEEKSKLGYEKENKEDFVNIILRCNYEKKELTNKITIKYGEKIIIAEYDDLPTPSIGDTLIHELIHYFFHQSVKNKLDKLKEESILLYPLFNEFLAYTFEDILDISQEKNSYEKYLNKLELNKDKLDYTIKNLNDLIVFYFNNITPIPVFPEVVYGLPKESVRLYLNKENGKEKLILGIIEDLILNYYPYYDYSVNSVPLTYFLLIATYSSERDILNKIKEISVDSHYKLKMSCEFIISNHINRKDKIIKLDEELCELLVSSDFLTIEKHKYKGPIPSCEVNEKVKLSLYNTGNKTKIEFHIKNKYGFENSFKKEFDLIYFKKVLNKPEKLLENLIKEYPKNIFRNY